MKRVALDTDAINRLLDTGLLQEVITAAKRLGVVFVLVHVVKDQRRAQLLAVCGALPMIEPPTSGLVLNTSRLDSAELQDSAKVAAVTTTGRGKIQDALIGATAADKADVLVTNDKKLTKRVKVNAAAVEVWTFERLVRFLRIRRSQVKRRTEP